jgi:hypothetical protein
MIEMLDDSILETVTIKQEDWEHGDNQNSQDMRRIGPQMRILGAEGWRRYSMHTLQLHKTLSQKGQVQQLFLSFSLLVQ